MKEKLIYLAIIGTVLSVLVAVGLALAGFRTPIQSGEYTGQTIDYSHQRGLIFQTNDLTTKTNDRSSTREDWCVPDNQPELVEKVRNIDNGQKIVIDYYAPIWIWPGTCGMPHKVIEEVTVVNQTG